MLWGVIIFSFVCIISLLIAIPRGLHLLYKRIALAFVNWILIIAVVVWIQFNGLQVFAQQQQFLWLSNSVLGGFPLELAIDGISIFFLLLTILIFPFCILAVWELPQSKTLVVMLLWIELFLILAFSVQDLFFFCLFFEGVLIPMFYIILVWGGRERRIKAVTYFVMYTILGSVFLFGALFLVYFEFSSVSFSQLSTHLLSITKQRVLWLLFFLVFAIKIPIFPFHIWLPEAHVEAPTVGSVILAGLLLKLGGYGILRFLFLFEEAKYFFQPLAMTLCLMSIFFASLMAIRQLDMKRIVAYSSIAHMNFALLGYFSNTIYGFVGGSLLMVSHGLVSSSLFLLIGVLYDRHHSRSVLYYSGLVHFMPLYCFFIMVFLFSNFSFPGTSNFCGELLVFIGLGQNVYKFILVLAGLSTLFGLLASMFLYNRIMFGSTNQQTLRLMADVDRREFFLLLPLLVLNFILGFYPTPVVNTMYAAILLLL